jgi:lipopolysaccharide/colanic/teichoic acid biosynthesis glycosyltransferase
MTGCDTSNTESQMRGQLLLKRGIDLAASFTGLVLLSPVLVLIAILVFVDSPGPVLFRQPRLGLNAKAFNILKFRTMTIDPALSPPRSADGANIVVRNDRRITGIGRWLRELSLDELPQLWNVLCGEMSLVGPRPDEILALDLYADNEREKLLMRPGITGLAMVNGRNSIPWRKRIDWDVRYVKQFSLRLDFLILLKTARMLLMRRGIYNP